MTNANAELSKHADVQWSSSYCRNPIILPEKGFSVTEYIDPGMGIYRIACDKTHEWINCIVINFQPNFTQLRPKSIPESKVSVFYVKGKKIMWRSYKVFVSGQTLIRKEILMPNILPRDNKEYSKYIYISIDAESQQLLEKLTIVAENIIKNAT